jgi:hypothetical protein
VAEIIDRVATGILNLALITALPLVGWLFAAPLL